MSTGFAPRAANSGFKNAGLIAPPWTCCWKLAPPSPARIPTSETSTRWSPSRSPRNSTWPGDRPIATTPLTKFFRTIWPAPTLKGRRRSLSGGPALGVTNDVITLDHIVNPLGRRDRRNLGLPHKRNRCPNWRSSRPPGLERTRAIAPVDPRQRSSALKAVCGRPRPLRVPRSRVKPPGFLLGPFSKFLKPPQTRRSASGLTGLQPGLGSVPESSPRKYFGKGAPTSGDLPSRPLPAGKDGKPAHRRWSYFPAHSRASITRPGVSCSGRTRGGISGLRE